MSVTNYYSVGGRLLGEQTAGLPRIDYLTDALGSVTATVDQTGMVQNTYRYKPYGALLAKTGTAPDPAFTWVGEQGYRQTGRKYSDVYVRARHYGTNSALWTTKDTADGMLDLFGYTAGNPSTSMDSSGLASDATITCQLDLKAVTTELCKRLPSLLSSILKSYVNGCVCSAQFTGSVKGFLSTGCLDGSCKIGPLPVPSKMTKKFIPCNIPNINFNCPSVSGTATGACGSQCSGPCSVPNTTHVSKSFDLPKTISNIIYTDKGTNITCNMTLSGVYGKITLTGTIKTLSCGPVPHCFDSQP